MGSTGSTHRHHVVIKPNQNWVRINFVEMWEFRDLLFAQVRRDFLTRYAQTILGPIWFLIQPLIMTLVFTVVFGKMADISTDGIPHVLFYMTGLVPWQYFSGTFNSVAGTFIGNQHIFAKIYFPRLLVPLTVAVSNMVGFLIQCLQILGFWIYFRFFTPSGVHLHVGPAILLLPLLILQIALMSIGAGLIMSVITARYRDLQHLGGFIMQVLLYLSAVIVPLSSTGEWRFLAALNPMSAVIESIRIVTLGYGSVTRGDILYSVGMTVAMLMVGVMVFQRAERTVVDAI